MKNILISILIAVVVIMVILGLAYAGYSVNRWWNWKFGYESRTQVLIEKSMKEHIEKYHKGEIK